METNTEFNNLFEDVVELFGQNQNKLLMIKQLIEETELVKKPTKKVLLGRISNIFAESNAIVEKLAALGKIK